MKTKRKNVLFSVIFILSVVACLGILTSCGLNYTNAFSIKTASSDDLKKKTSNDQQILENHKNSDNQVVHRPNPSDSNNNEKPETQKPNIEENNGEKAQIQKPKINDSNTYEDDVDRSKDHNIDKSENIKGDSIKQKSDETVNDDQGAEAVPVAQIIWNSTNKELKRVAITFDDGPDGRFTPQVLDILKEKNVKATFFIYGAIADKNRDVLKRIGQEGHAIGNHSWSHCNFTKVSQGKVINEIKKTGNLIEEVLGKSSSLLRLPYGAYNEKVLNTVAEQGYHNIYWSIDTRDWSGDSPTKITNTVKKNLQPGSIILMHSFGSQKSISKSIKALPGIIEYIQGQGYELVTIPELLKEDPLTDK